MKKVVPEGAHLIPGEARKVFSGQIFDVYQWQQKLFDGSEATFEMLKRPDIAETIAIKDGQVVIVKQKQPHWKDFRYTLPAGRAEPDEPAIEAAKRECREETGMTFRSWKLLEVRQYSEKIQCFIYIFLATGFELQGEVEPDAGEQLETVLMDFDEVKTLSKEEPRLAEGSFDKFDSIDELMSAPEFEGQEIDL